MAIREYVGARYVPRFTGLYDATQIYDALDVADNGSGTSYIAKKTVPAGTALTDTEYWFVYGASSGAILDLQNRMGTAENDIITINGEITELQTKQITFIGDSYLADNITVLRSTLRKAFPCPISFSSRAAIGFVQQSGGETIIQLLDDVPETERNQTEVLITYAGINDVGNATYATLKQAVVDYITRARTLYPNARLMIFGPQATPTLNLASGYTDACEAIRDACRLNAVGYYNPSLWLINTSEVYADLYLADRVHPSAAGCEVIASHMVSAIYGSDNDSDMKLDITVSNAGDEVDYVLDGNILHFTFRSADSVALTQNQYYHLFSFDDKYSPFLSKNAIFPVGMIYNNRYVVDIAGYAYVNPDNHSVSIVPMKTLTGKFICSGFLIFDYNKA